MKKNLTKLTVILPLFILAMIPLSVNAITYNDTLSYKINNDNTITITECNSSTTEIIIPNEINGLIVTDIDDEAFRWCRSLKSITIPSSITHIGKYCFEMCTNLENLYISNLISWCNIDFDDLSSNPMRYAQKVYVNGKRMQNVTIPSEVRSIKSYSFNHCLSLNSIIIPNSVKSIGDYAFSECENLSNIELGDNITNIGTHAFSECDALSDIQLPQSLQSISEFTFSWCDSLNQIVIPDSVTSIERCAFYGCENLTNVEISNNVTNIGSSAFGYCKSLLHINLPNNLAKIPDSLFYECKNLETVTMPSTVSRIGKSAFKGCRELVEITLPNSITYIGDTAFSCCMKITNISLPNSMACIESNTFEYCSNLKAITIPKSITEIEVNSFVGCTSINSVEYTGNENEWNEIYIGSGNDHLTNATITFNSSLSSVFTKTEINNNNFTVTPINIPNGSTIIFVCYNDKQMVYVEPFIYAGEDTKTFTSDKEYDKVKVMVWGNLKTLVPLCEAEEIPLN